MVVDWPWTHPYQAEILLFTLQKYAATPPAAITVQCTDRVREDVRSAFREQGCQVVTIAPYLDGIYCNKIAQLDCLAEQGTRDCQGVFLLDLDIAVLAPLDVPDPTAVCGKVVDGGNPELAIIERIFAAADLALPKVVPCDWADGGNTIATNFNGGFLYIPSAHLRPLRHAWRRWAEFLFARPDLFTDETRKHLDQVSFAMALAATGIPYRHLASNWNFPCHEEHRLRLFVENESLRALHYHDRLDEFGLLAPEVSGYAALDEAVERLNGAIGQRHTSMFFDLFKRQQAKRAVSRAPAIGSQMFSAQFVARTWVGTAKRRLILHAGTPKTGTSSLQRHLGGHRQRLAELGWWYPAPSDTPEPKHQQLNDVLRQGDPRAFAAYIEDALRDMPDHAHTVVFTTEGIFNHWWDYSPLSKGMLRQLAALFDFELCVWFRPPLHFAAALYAQYVKNPHTTDTPRNVYGKDIAFSQALDDPWFRRHLDYLGFYHEARALLGDRVRAFPFGGDTVKTFIDHYNVPLPPAHRWRNTSLRSAGLDLIRLVNRFQLSARDQRQVVALVDQIDNIVGERSSRFHLAEADQRAVERYAQRGWETLQPMLKTSPIAPRQTTQSWPSAAEWQPPAWPRALAKRKVFCIGFHKTGTKSLAAALRMLGYRVIGPNGAQERDIASHALGMALAVATTFDAFNDNPWPILYKELDTMFPGSRFILTVRESERWFASVVRHFGNVETPMREWIYGAGSPLRHEDRYVRRYQAHNREVQRYFKGRDDLLVMDLEGGDGWAEICPFLGVPAPSSEFPHENRSD